MGRRMRHWIVLAIIGILINFSAMSVQMAHAKKEVKEALDSKQQLTRALEVEDDAKWAFLSKLSDSEQAQLAERIAYLLDEEGGVVVSILAASVKILPNFLVVSMAQAMEPETVAKLSNKLPVKTVVKIAKGMKREFVVEVTKKLNPQKATAIIEALPMELVTDVIRRLMAQNDDKTLAKLGDYLSPEKLKEISQSLTPEENVRIANQMKNKHLIAKILTDYPDDYLLKLIKECFRLEYYALVASISEEMENARLLSILDQLEKEEIPKAHFLAEVSMHINPAKPAAIIEALPDELVIEVARYLVLKDAFTVMAGLADQLPPEKLQTLSRELTARNTVQIANQMKNRRVITKILSSFSDEYLIEMTQECASLNYSGLVIEVMAGMDKARSERIIGVLESQKKISPEFLKFIR